MSLKSFKNISNFRNINKIFKIDILNYDFEDVLLPSNSFKYFSGLSAKEKNLNGILPSH